MKTLKDAIEIILGEPPEAHYPSYYASLLRKADVPDKDVGKCSEIPNGSDLISRQAVIDELYDWSNHTMTDAETWHLRQVIGDIKSMPSAEPDIAEKLYQYKCYITDQEGLQHEVIHVGDIRRVTGWEI